MNFTKLFNSILDSTIWQEAKETKLVWITMLAMCDRNGDVFASIPGLAVRAGVTIEECESAIRCLMSPDPYSRTKVEEGRRIRDIDGGWELVNHGKYRALLSAEERKEYNRQKQAEYRQRASKMSKNVNDNRQMSMTCNPLSAMSTHTEADAESESDSEATKPPSKKTPNKPVAALPLPFSSDAFAGAWGDWESSRKEAGKPIKPTARKLQFAKLAAMGEPRAIEALGHSAASGYAGIFEPSGNGGGRNGKQMPPLDQKSEWEIKAELDKNEPEPTPEENRSAYERIFGATNENPK